MNDILKSETMENDILKSETIENHTKGRRLKQIFTEAKKSRIS